MIFVTQAPKSNKPKPASVFIYADSLINAQSIAANHGLRDKVIGPVPDSVLARVEHSAKLLGHSRFKSIGNYLDYGGQPK